MLSFPQIWPVGAPSSLLLCLFDMTPLFYDHFLVPRYISGSSCAEIVCATRIIHVFKELWHVQGDLWKPYICTCTSVFILYLFIYIDNFEFTLTSPIPNQHRRFILASSFRCFHHFSNWENSGSHYFNIPTFSLSIRPCVVPSSALRLP